MGASAKKTGASARPPSPSAGHGGPAGGGLRSAPPCCPGTNAGRRAASERRAHWTDAAIAAGLALLALALYANTLTNPFVIDDHVVIERDPRVGEFDLKALLTQEYWPPPGGSMLYRPLTSASFALNWAIVPRAWAFRLVNLLAFSATATVLYAFVRGLTNGRGTAAVAAVFFVLHPIRTGALNCAVDRAEIFVGFFGLLALWLVLRDLRRPGHRSLVRPLLAALAFAAAVFSKEHALALIGVAVLTEWFVRHQAGGQDKLRSLRQTILRSYVPLVLVAMSYLAIRGAVLGTVVRPQRSIRPIDNFLVQPATVLAPGQSVTLARWGTPLAVLARAVGLMIWPQPLCWDYSYAAIDAVRRGNDPQMAAGAVIVLLALAVLVWSWRARSVAFVAIGFCLITYSIVSNTYVLIGTLFGERFLYIPSAGWCLGLGLAATWAWRVVRTRHDIPMRALAAIVLTLLVAGAGGYAWLTIDRNRDYRSDDVLNAVDVAKYPRSARLQGAVAAGLLAAGQPQAALGHALRAIELMPNFTDPWRLAGKAYYQMNDGEKAFEYLDQALRLGADDEDTWVSACELIKSGGDYARAIGLLREYVKVRPRAAAAHHYLSRYLLTAEPPTLRDPRRALEYAQTAVRLEPIRAVYVDTYITALLALGRDSEATRELERLVPGIPVDDPGRPTLVEELTNR